ncbi:hypothetical protein [Streptacidiphilus melanogenes]|uniref:hypothetical protein n=1 Tax=Streptacidiphilus melanogenes TaxID=411235 RepID=UPI0005A7E2C5|nr:hypothetical protein [Streptacidiphilus melanogenes]
MSWPDAGDELREDLDEAQLGKPEPWYYCLRHHRPEQGHQEPARFLLGPFPTEEAASHALEKIEENEEAWAKKDRVDRELRGEGGAS